MILNIKELIAILQKMELNGEGLTNDQLDKINDILYNKSTIDINCLKNINWPDSAIDIIKLYLYKNPSAISVIESLLNNRNALISFNTVSGVENIYNKIKNLLHNDIELLDFLKNLTPKARVNIGRGELLLSLVCNNGRFNGSDKDGDIIIDIDNKTVPVEIKTESGRIGGVNAGITGHIAVMNNIKEILINYYTQLSELDTSEYFTAVKSASSFMIASTSARKSSFRKSMEYYLCDILKKNNVSLDRYKVLAEETFKNIVLSLFVNKQDVIRDIDLIFKDYVQIDIESGRMIKNPVEFMNLINILYLKLYKKYENFNYFLIMNSKTYNVAVFDFTDMEHLTPYVIAHDLKKKGVTLKNATISYEARQAIAPQIWLE